MQAGHIFAPCRHNWPFDCDEHFAWIWLFSGENSRKVIKARHRNTWYRNILSLTLKEVSTSYVLLSLSVDTERAAEIYADRRQAYSLCFRNECTECAEKCTTLPFFSNPKGYLSPPSLKKNWSKYKIVRRAPLWWWAIPISMLAAIVPSRSRAVNLQKKLEALTYNNNQSWL